MIQWPFTERIVALNAERELLRRELADCKVLVAKSEQRVHYLELTRSDLLESCLSLQGRLQDAEKRYHELADRITAKAFAPPPEAPQTHVTQPEPSAEYNAMRRINESTINRMIPDLVAEGLKPDEARLEAERIVLAMDSIADPAGLTMLEGVLAPRSTTEGPT